MKTIEERARYNLMYEQDFCGNRLNENMVCRAYAKGCYDQKAIDIEKAWSLMCSIYQVGMDNLIPLTKDEFIKAIEE